MRFLTWIVVSLILTVAGCSAGSLGSGGPGGSVSKSPGTVTLQFMLPDGETFCDENASCSVTQHLWVSPSAGSPLMLGSYGCTTSCSACQPIACPEVALIACPAGNSGAAVTDSTFTWDGSYAENGSCENAAGSIACVAFKFAAPGMYVARFCATPGTLTQPDGGVQPLCTPTATQSCVETAFAFPSSQPVVIALPPG